MLMNPTLTSAFHPGLSGIALEGVRHDLNRLYYNPDYLRGEMLDPSVYGGYPYMPMSPYYGVQHPSFGYRPFGHGYETWPRVAEYPYGRGFEGWARGTEYPYARGYEGWARGTEYPYARGFEGLTRGGEYPYGRGFEGWARTEYPYARGFEGQGYPYGRGFEGQAYPYARGFEGQARSAEYPGMARGTELPYALPIRPLETGSTFAPEAGYQQMPVCNFAETQDACLFVIELPGVDLKDITLQIHGANLVLTAFRRPTWSNGTVTVNYHLAEGRFGTLRRVLALPAGVLPGQIQANFINGMLTILLPRTGGGTSQMPQASIVINSAVPTTM